MAGEMCFLGSYAFLKKAKRKHTSTTKAEKDRSLPSQSVLVNHRTRASHRQLHHAHHNRDSLFMIQRAWSNSITLDLREPISAHSLARIPSSWLD